jgi:hypothetical protein
MKDLLTGRESFVSFVTGASWRVDGGLGACSE